jgi:hypothetical protein
VVALGRGGVLESVPMTDPQGGVFYTKPDEASLTGAIEKFERMESHISATSLQSWAARFSEQNFVDQMKTVLAAESGPSIAP